jgi:hypothetical protein
VLVLDVMLPWERERTTKSILFPHGFNAFEGGFHVAKVLREIPILDSIPIVFYSVGDSGALFARQFLRKEHRENLYFASKNQPDEQVAKLLISIVSAQIEVAPPPRKSAGFLDAIELKPGAFGFKVDLKKLFGAGKSDA